MPDYVDQSPDMESRPGFPRWIGIVGGLITLVLVSTLILLLNLTNRERDQALDQRRNAYERVIAIREAAGELDRADVTLARAAIASDKSLAVMASHQWNRADQLFRRLRALTPDDSPSAQALAKLIPALEKRTTEMGRVGAYLSFNRRVDAVSAFYAAEKSGLREGFDALVDQAVAIERRTLTDAVNRADAADRRSDILIILVSIAGLLVAAGTLFLGWLAAQAVLQRTRARAASEENLLRAEVLESAVVARTAELSEANARLESEMRERLRTENQLRQSQKMEAIGQLTGGIAHDFNNMLAIVVGGIELARRKLAGGQDVGPHLERAMEGANRAAALTKRLLTFARAEPVKAQKVDVNDLISSMTDLIGRTLGAQIEIKSALAEDIWPVLIDNHQLENGILNLAVNARDAMAGTGTLTISTCNRAGDPDTVTITVADTGTGMSPDVRERALEPFFTTKEAGKGTGLGLSQIFGMMKQADGDIEIDTAEGKGTRITLILPRHDDIIEKGAASVETLSPEPLPPLHALSILVVEDDPRVRAATVSALGELGHECVECEGGDIALSVLEVKSDFDLVLSDVVMPGMTGPAMAREVVKRYPELPILFVTGYAASGEDDEIFGRHPVLRKPFTLSQLEIAVTSAAFSGWHQRETGAATA